MSKYVFGEIPNQPVGSPYENRKEAMAAGVHQLWVQGIVGNRTEGCVSICLNGGYDTDEDYGHEIFYTGSGGQDPSTKKHVRDQELDDSDNAALVKSEETGLPIRILRGYKGEKDHSPKTGYRYDGLYKVLKHYSKYPPDGHRRWMFHLVQLTPEEASSYTPEENKDANAAAFAEQDLGSGPVQPQVSPSLPPAALVDPYAPDEPVDVFIPSGNAAPGSKTVISQRVIRDTKVTRAVKAMYDGRCQVCSIRLPTKSGNYAEGAHIRPLGKPHHGPDIIGNILCLCPNHHAVFDKGGLYFDDEMTAHDHTGKPIGAAEILPTHLLDLDNIRYHRAHHGF